MIARMIAVLVFFFFSVISVQAAVYRVNNNGGTDANFSNFADAQASANAGDTLYIEASPTSYGNITIIKNFTIIGPGYFINENPDTQANPHSATFGNIAVNSGSNGTTITGITGSKLTVASTVSNISIQRNKLQGIALSGTNANIIIIQNYLAHSSGDIITLGAASSANILNNIIKYLGTSNSYCLKLNITSSALIQNNVMDGYNYCLYAYNSSIYNNIIIKGFFTNMDNNIYQHNIGNATQFGTADGNQSNVDMSTVFKFSGSTEGQYELKSGSPAIGAGEIGGTVVDCGIFGGPDSYVFSGIPHIPAVYYFSAPSSTTASSGLSIHIKTKSRN